MLLLHDVSRRSRRSFMNSILKASVPSPVKGHVYMRTCSLYTASPSEPQASVSSARLILPHSRVSTGISFLALRMLCLCTRIWIAACLAQNECSIWRSEGQIDPCLNLAEQAPDIQSELRWRPARDRYSGLSIWICHGGLIPTRLGRRVGDFAGLDLCHRLCALMTSFIAGFD